MALGFLNIIPSLRYDCLFLISSFSTCTLSSTNFVSDSSFGRHVGSILLVKLGGTFLATLSNTKSLPSPTTSDVGETNVADLVGVE